jgi:ABC-type lipoprotein release transport system permease subunit
MSEYMETPKKSNMPFIVIIAILFIGVAVLAVMLSRANSQLDDMTNENLTLKADMEMMNEMMAPFIGDNVSDNLLKDFNNMLNDYDKIIKEGRPEDQDAMKEQQDKIQGLITELETAKKNGRVSGALIAKLNRENETLRTIMKGYIKQIDELNTKNLQLTSDLDKTSSELTNTKSERDQFKQEAEESA